MARELLQSEFSNKPDTVIDFQELQVLSDIQALNGQDVIEGYGADGADGQDFTPLPSTTFNWLGSGNTPVGDGFTAIQGQTGGDGENGVTVSSGKSLSLGNGIDNLLGVGGDGGAGGDIQATASGSQPAAIDGIGGWGGDGGDGLLVEGKVTGDNGKDFIVGIGGNGGDAGEPLDNPNSGAGIEIAGYGGDGGDGIVVGNGASIKTGNGDDEITGIGGLGGSRSAFGSTTESANGYGIPVNGANGYAIVNEGVIDTGRGDDIVDASQGGITGGGKVYLGQGDDIFKGFGDQEVYGGKGYDTLFLTGAGEYSVTANNGGFDIGMGGTTMTIFEFEAINGLAFADGDVITVL